MSVVVVGAGGHAKVVVATLRASGVAVVGVLDDDPAAGPVLGAPRLGPTADVSRIGLPAVLAVGDNAARRRLAEAHPGVDWTATVHPAAVVHESARVGAGAVVVAGAVVQPDAVLGRHAIVNTGASVDHDAVVGDFAHVGPGARLAGGVRLGEGAFVGTAAACVPGVRVGAWATVGAGAVVVASLPDRVVAVGVPARPLRSA